MVAVAVEKATSGSSTIASIRYNGVSSRSKERFASTLILPVARSSTRPGPESGSVTVRTRKSSSDYSTATERMKNTWVVYARGTSRSTFVREGSESSSTSSSSPTGAPTALFSRTLNTYSSRLNRGGLSFRSFKPEFAICFLGIHRLHNS